MYLRKVALFTHQDKNLIDQTINVSYIRSNMFDNRKWIGLHGYCDFKNKYPSKIEI